MNKEIDLKSGFKINNIILMNSSFKRESSVEFDTSKIDANVDFNLDVQVNKNSIFVPLTISYQQMNKDKGDVEVDISISMLGVFEKIGESTISNLEEFGRVNGAAIIFPYIREHITNVCSKAGIGNVVLPPMNFTKYPKNQNKKEA